MHDETCNCELCREYSAHEEETALNKLMQAVELMRGKDSVPSSDEGRDLELAAVVRLDAGLSRAIPAVIFHPPSRLRKLKAGFTYSYLLESGIDEIAESLRNNMREPLSE